MRAWSRRLPSWLAVLLVGAYLIRAATGVVSGLAYWSGAPSAAAGYYPEALRHLGAAAVGFNRFEALWLAGESKVGLWDEYLRRGRPVAAAHGELEDAAAAFFETATLSPASAWPWSGLASVYERREKAARAVRTVDLSRLSEGPWGVVGRDGRIAVGLLRKAIEREPEVFSHRDRAVSVLFGFGLVADAAEELRRSARVQPVGVFHSTLDFDRLPRFLVEAFAMGARDAIGQVPLQRRERHFLSLGRLARQLGNLGEAEAYLRAALREPANSIGRSEDAYHLALVLIDLGRYEEAEQYLDVANREPVFGAAVLAERARIAKRRGDLAKAMEWIQEARRLQPKNVALCVEHARIARELRDWRAAEEALRWASLVSPENPLPRAEFVELYLENGNFAAALLAIEQLERMPNGGTVAPRLRARLARALAEDDARRTRPAPFSPDSPGASEEAR